MKAYVKKKNASIHDFTINISYVVSYMYLHMTKIIQLLYIKVINWGDFNRINECPKFL